MLVGHSLRTYAENVFKKKGQWKNTENHILTNTHTNVITPSLVYFFASLGHVLGF